MKKIICAIIIIATLTSCSRKEFRTYVCFTIGTAVSIVMPEKYESYVKEISEYIDYLGSIIKQDENNINSANINKKIIVSNETIDIYKKSLFYYNINNKYDPSVYTVSSLYGFPSGPYSIPSNENIEKGKNNAGFHNLLLEDNYLIKKKQLKVNFSANSKGYIVDKTSSFMKDKGIKNFIVNAGGDMYASGKKNGEYFIAGIINPIYKPTPLSIIKLKNMAVATSGNYERFFVEDNQYINHIFSGITFETSNNYKSISVIAESTEKADGFATLFYLLNIEEIKKHCEKFNVPVLILKNNDITVKLCNWEKYE